MGRVKSAAMTVDDFTSPHELVQHRRSLRSPLQPLRSSLAAGLRYGSVTDFAPLDCAASGLT